MQRPSYADFRDGFYNEFAFIGFDEDDHRFDDLIYYIYHSEEYASPIVIAKCSSLLEAINYAYDRAVSEYDGRLMNRNQPDELHERWETDRYQNDNAENIYEVTYEIDNSESRMKLQSTISVYVNGGRSSGYRGYRYDEY